MSPQMNGEPREMELTKADRPVLEAINTDGVTQTTIQGDAKLGDAKLAPLFTRDAATDFRSRWDVVQRSFVDDPQEAVRAGDELVTQVIESLAETFANQRSELESRHDKGGATGTENLRLALRRYRSFFERLLSI
jgi:hypothetical protein